MPERMARSIVMTGKAETGQRIAATDGNLQAGRSRTFSSSNTHDQLVSNELKTSAAQGHEVSGQAEGASPVSQKYRKRIRRGTFHSVRDLVPAIQD